jgi:exodeoxyribonuclease-3
MKIATYNGENGRLPRLLEWLAEASPEVVCLQELKTDDSKFPIQAIETAGTAASGMANVRTMVLRFISKDETPVELRRGLPGELSDVQTRYLG